MRWRTIIAAVLMTFSGIAQAQPSPESEVGVWTRYPTSYPAGTEAEYQSWYNLAYDTNRDVFYGVDWFGVISKFDPIAQRWTKLSPNIGGGTHNRVLAYDPVNDRVWYGDGTGSQLTGVNYFDPTTNQWIAHPITGARFGAQSAMIYDAPNKRFVVFGGWFRLSVHTFAVDPPASVMVSAGLAGGPEWDTTIYKDAKKMTAQRSGLDAPRNRIFYVDTDGSLWFLPMSLSGWQHVTPSGPMPPAHTQYVYDQSTDSIVGWSAANAVAGGAEWLPPERETWILPLSTLTWQKTANAADGATVPPRTVYVGYALAYDPVRQQTILHTLTAGGNYAPETWAYRSPDGGPSPTPPGAPVDVVAVAGDGQATVTFAPPASDGGSPITGYWVVSSPAGGVDVDAGSTATSHVVTGLTNGVSYTFTVVAANTVGTGDPSAPSNSVTPGTLPGTPSNVVATAGNAQAVVSFPAASDGGSPITRYDVQSDPPGGTDLDAGTARTTHTLTGLVNGTAYTFTVTATNAIGQRSALGAVEQRDAGDGARTRRPARRRRRATRRRRWRSRRRPTPAAVRSPATR